MPLNQIPVLPESYPLFDWADYQSSRDALVKGTPTRQFAVAAWNALVDDLEGALSGAGIAWDETYTTADGAKIQTVPGKLSSDAFNSVRLNIDRPAPLGWQWALNENFRGYVGREEMQGVATHGKARDRVFPEYIIELARKLNVLIEIMRGTAATTDLEIVLASGINTDLNAESQMSKRIYLDHKSSTTIAPGIDSIQGSITDVDQKSSTMIDTDADIDHAAYSPVYVNIPLLINTSGTKALADPMDLHAIPNYTTLEADANSAHYSETDGSVISALNVFAIVNAQPPEPISNELDTATSVNAEVAHGASLEADQTALFRSAVEATAAKEKSRPAISNILSAVHLSVEVERMLIEAISGFEMQQQSKSTTATALSKGESGHFAADAHGSTNLYALCSAVLPSNLGSVLFLARANSDATEANSENTILLGFLDQESTALLTGNASSATNALAAVMEDADADLKDPESVTTIPSTQVRVSTSFECAFPYSVETCTQAFPAVESDCTGIAARSTSNSAVQQIWQESEVSGLCCAERITQTAERINARPNVYMIAAWKVYASGSETAHCCTTAQLKEDVSNLVQAANLIGGSLMCSGEVMDAISGSAHSGAAVAWRAYLSSGRANAPFAICAVSAEYKNSIVGLGSRYAVLQCTNTRIDGLHSISDALTYAMNAQAAIADNHSATVRGADTIEAKTVGTVRHKTQGEADTDYTQAFACLVDVAVSTGANVVQWSAVAPYAASPLYCQTTADFLVWKRPIRTGNHLSIRQAGTVAKKGNHLHIK